MIGSLLLGMYDDAGRLTYVGHVGTGFTQQALHELGRQLAPLARPTAPFELPVPREHGRDDPCPPGSAIGVGEPVVVLHQMQAQRVQVTGVEILPPGQFFPAPLLPISHQ